jgi:hypothetical protein
MELKKSRNLGSSLLLAEKTGKLKPRTTSKSNSSA